MQIVVFLSVFILSVLGFLLLPVFLGFLAGLWEKRFVWPYVTQVDVPASTPAPSNPYAPPAASDPIPITPYALAVGSQAQRLGLDHVGQRYNGTGKLYKFRYDFWLTPDAQTLAMIGTGALAGIPVEATRLYTLLTDGHGLLTVDEAKGGDSDISGMTEQLILARAHLPELLRTHNDRIAAHESRVVPFTPNDPLAELRVFHAARANRLISLGIAKYIDESHQWFKLTVRGAFLTALRTYFRERERAFRDRDRINFKLPRHAEDTSSGRPHRRVLVWIGYGKTA